MEEVGLGASLAVVRRVLSCAAGHGEDSDGDDDVDDGTAADMYARVTGLCNSYGRVVQTLRLPLQDGTFYEWSVAHPCALLPWLCSECPQLEAFIREHCSGQVNRVVFWGDETVGGNPLRPDNRTKFLAVYWSFLELPDWYRVLDHGWIPIGFIKADTLKDVVSGYSGVLKHVRAPLAPTADPSPWLNSS